MFQLALMRVTTPFCFFRFTISLRVFLFRVILVIHDFVRAAAAKGFEEC
jgi:hypothetical protein